MQVLELIFFTGFCFFAYWLARLDITTNRLPNATVALFFVFSLLRFLCLPSALEEKLSSLFWPLLLVIFLGIISTIGYRRQKIIFGMGDVKLTAALGLWFGQRLITLYFWSSLAAFISFLCWRLIFQKKRQTIPFAPFLLLVGLTFELRRIWHSFCLL